MLTLRARWLLAASAVMITIGIVGEGRTILALIGLTLVLWITAEGLLFLYRLRCVVRNLRLRRIIRDTRGPVGSFWAGRAFEVHARLFLDNGYLPYLAFEEQVPFGLAVTSGATRGEGALGNRDVLDLRYHVKAGRPGRVRFEGVRVQLADLHGLFHHVAFVRLEQSYRVLPSLVDAEGKTATGKRYNMLPPPGIHRLPRPGSGSELLDLRDYLPGDPPKTIAWKVSARRDKLITKEYESEVPIRCTLFIDTSPSVRLGPPGRNALTRLVEIASGVAQANLASRDMTGLCLFDEERTRLLKPARTRRHLIEVFNQLADAAGLASEGGTASVDLHLRLAYTFAQEVYPEQLDAQVNHVPAWLPFFVPTPSNWVTPTSLRTHLYRWLVGGPAAILYLLLGLVVLGEMDALLEDIPEGWREEVFWPLDLWPYAFLVLFFLLFPLWMMLWRDALPLLFSPRRRRFMFMRKKMAALFSTRYALGGGGLELLLQDDRHLSVYLERFLNEHHIPHTPRLFDRKGRYLFASPAKLEVLSAALLRAIGKGHDNELFVLFLDLVELGPHLDPLLKAVKVALARHHQVMVIIPWPPDLDPPGREETEASVPTAAVAAPAKRLDIKARLKRLTGRRYLQTFHKARRTFARLQVPVVCAADRDSITLILDRIDRLRGLRRRR